MTKPSLARQTSEGRVYPWPPQDPQINYPGVTSILNEVSKPFLKPWGEKLVATYAVENRDVWGDLPPEDAIDLIKRAPLRNMQSRGRVGTAVHDAIDIWTQTGEPPTINDLELLPYVAQAIDWLGSHVTEVLYAEQTIFNATYQYAGTFDMIAKLNTGETAIIDWKTSKNIYPETAIQLCAYSKGEWIGTETGQQITLPHIDIGIVVHLTPDKGWTAKTVNLQDTQAKDIFKTFTALRRMHYWRQNTEPNVYTKTEKQASQ